MNNTGIILTLAYPETTVRVSTDWIVPYLRFIGIGKKNYVRAGHAAIVLVNKNTGALDYYDFGRYIVPEPYGRVRSKVTDHELDFLIKAKIENGQIKNLNDILKLLATNPKLTHGDGKLVASVCNDIDYDKAKTFIVTMQEEYFIPYSVFTKNASNCSRFVTSVLINSVTDRKIKKKLIKSTRFTPSTVGNVVNANTGETVYEVSPNGNILHFESTIKKENLKYFRDKLKRFSPNLLGNIKPKQVNNVHEKAQWLSGIGAGAWFELHKTKVKNEYRYKRTSPYGNIDVDAIYLTDDNSFNFEENYEFAHHSNCQFFHIKQSGNTFKFTMKTRLN